MNEINRRVARLKSNAYDLQYRIERHSTESDTKDKENKDEIDLNVTEPEANGNESNQ